MLTIRYLRSGRRNQSFFRIVLTEKSKPPKSGFLKILGWYNPHTKESFLNKEEILAWLDKGAQPSNSIAKLLEKNKISHKLVKFIPAKPRPKKEKGGDGAAKDKEAAQEPAPREQDKESEPAETVAEGDSEEQGAKEKKELAEKAPAEDSGEAKGKPRPSDNEDKDKSEKDKSEEEKKN